MALEPDRKLDGVEAGLACLRDEIVYIAEVGCIEELLRDIVLNPGGSAECGQRVALEIALFDDLRVANNLPAIAGEIRAMNDEHAYSPAASGFLVLIGPAAVIGESFAFEELFIV